VAEWLARGLWICSSNPEGATCVRYSLIFTKANYAFHPLGVSKVGLALLPLGVKVLIRPTAAGRFDAPTDEFGWFTLARCLGTAIS